MVYQKLLNRFNKCPNCDEVLPSKKKLKQHVKDAHDGKLPLKFGCRRNCSKRFPITYTRDQHEKNCEIKVL